MGPLAGLTSLQSLQISECNRLADLSPLTGLKSLQSLNLFGLSTLHEFNTIKELLASLKVLYLFRCKVEDLPSELCGNLNEDVLANVRADYKDLEAGQRRDAEVKVLFLGNGGTGKTQLCRQLRGEPFDMSVDTTHGIQLSEKTIELEEFPELVRLNLPLEQKSRKIIRRRSSMNAQFRTNLPATTSSIFSR